MELFEKDNDLTARQIQALETKKTIFDSAMELFIKHGFYNVRVDDIVEKAGTSKGTFYVHFKSKDQVIVEHYKKIDEHYVGIFKGLPEEMSSYDKLLILFKEAYLYTEKIGKELLGVVLINQISGKEHIRHVTDPKRNIFKITLGLIQEGQKNGEFSNKINPESLTLLILQQHSGVFLTWKMLEGDSLVEMGTRTIQLFLESFLNN